MNEKQIKLLKEKLKKSEELLKSKENEIKSITFEAQKSIKAFQALFTGITLPQAVNDYYQLFESRQSKIPKQKQRADYLR